MAAFGLSGAARIRAAKTNSSSFPYPEFEARLARRDFRDMTKDVLPTPSMVVDLDLFEKNVKTMAGHCKASGINVRPHVKIHKSVDVAKRQIAEGAVGLTCATMAEAELMSGAGIKHVLWTKQPASVNNISRAVALSRRDPTFMFVVDDAQVAAWVEDAAAAQNARLKIAVSVFAGMTRQGIANGQPAVELAQKVTASKRLSFEGFMAYSGGAAHTKTWEARRKKSADDLAGVRETVELARKSGLPVKIVTLELIDSARKRGLDVSTEAYPYTAGQTRIESAMFDPGWQERLSITYKDLQWVATNERLTAESYESYRKTGGPVILHAIPEESARQAIAYPGVMIASDGRILRGKGHPRAAGTYARVLGH
jgi:hypothetical protein